MGDSFMGHGFEDAWPLEFFEAGRFAWVAEAMSWELDVAFDKPTQGMWDGGPKTKGSFSVKPSVMNAPPRWNGRKVLKLPALEVGSLELNRFQRFPLERYSSLGAFKAAAARVFKPKSGTNSWDAVQIYTHVLEHKGGVTLFGLKGGKQFEFTGASWRAIAAQLESPETPGLPALAGPEIPPSPNDFWDVDATYRVKQVVHAQHMAMTYNMRDFYFPEEGTWRKTSARGTLLVESPFV